MSVSTNFEAVRKAALILRSINHKLRQQMIDLLRENRKMTVTDLYIKLRLEQSVASQHLAILRRSGVVGTSRSGKFVFYFVNEERIKEIESKISELVVPAV